MNDQSEGEPISPIAAVKAGFEFRGQPLRPYSPSRKVAAQTMGMIYPFVGRDGQAQMEATGMYPGAIKDVLIVLWLCSLPDAPEVAKDAWSPSLALRRPVLAMDEAMEWAGALIDVGSAEWAEAFELFLKIVVPTEQAKFKSDASASGDYDGPKV